MSVSFYPTEPAIPRDAPGSGRAGWLTGGHWVILQAWNKNLSVAALYRDAKPTTSGGDWDVVERPRNVGITEWRGRRNKQLDLDILVEGWVTRPQGGLWIEGHLNTLEEMADTPLTLRVIGPVPFWGRQWVITGIEYGDAIRDQWTGKRMRQWLTLTLLEFVQPDDLAKLPRAKAEPVKTRDYTIVKGDDLQKIAAKKLGKATRWPEIEKLNNGMRGVKLDAKKFGVGKRIKIPAK